MSGERVLVVGGGPTGLATACALLANDVDVRVVDRAAGPATTSRALGLQPRGVEVLERLGALDDLRQRGLGIHQVVVHIAGRELARLAVGRPTSLVHQPGLLVSQTEIERSLRDRLAQLGGSVEWKTTVAGLQMKTDRVVVMVDGQQPIEAGWVVGCDGSRSAVRAAAGISFPGRPLVERFLLADVHADLPLSRHSVAVWLDGDEMLAVFPLPGADLWRLMSPAAPNLDGSAEVLDALVGALAQQLGTEVGVRGCDWTSTFRIQRRLADTYRVGRVFLAGDAAHIHSPFGGQGLNTGLGDAENLGWKRAMIIAEQTDASLLETYGAERRPVAEEVLASTSSLTGVVLGRSRPARMVRDHVLVPLMNTRTIQRMIWEEASQLKLSYRAGPLGPPHPGLGRWGAGPWGKGSRAGDRVPDTLGVGHDGQMTRLHAELNPRWVLMAPATEQGEACHSVAQNLLGADRIIRLAPPERDRRMLLVRPDAHCAWAGRDADSLRWCLTETFRGRPLPPPARALAADAHPGAPARHG